MSGEITNLEQMLERIYETADKETEISLGMLVEAVGSRSFGPLLLLAGIIMMSPISGIPGIPTIMGLVLVLIAGQLLFRRKHFWLPHWMLRRSASRGKVFKAIRHLRPVAHFVDRLLRPRLPFFIEGAATYVVAVICILVAVLMPLMEIVPFSIHAAGVAVTVFGLSLIARDGLLSIIAFAVTAMTFGVLIYNIIAD